MFRNECKEAYLLVFIVPTYFFLRFETFTHFSEKIFDPKSFCSKCSEMYVIIFFVEKNSLVKKIFFSDYFLFKSFKKN